MTRNRTEYSYWPETKWLDTRSNKEYISWKADDDFVNFNKEDNTFHIGQSYEKKAVTSLECKSCGGKEFNVGSGHCYTAIRCPNCKWEVLLHEG